MHELLPGLEEVRPAPPDVPLDAPVLVVPEGEARAVHFESRDREEELADLVRRIRALHRETPERSLSRVAIVCGRPLPYAYLAPGAFESGGVALQSRDALPLAAEPFAAALDLVFSAVSTLFSASPLTALLRSPHFELAGELPAASLADLAALDVGLAAFDHGGSASRLDELAEGWASGAFQPPRSPRWQSEGAARAARVAAATIRALEPLAVRQRASAALDALLAFLHRASAAVALDDPLRERHLRARRAVLSILDGLREAHARHHDLLWTIDELAATFGDGSKPRRSPRRAAGLASSSRMPRRRVTASSPTFIWSAWSTASGRFARGETSSTPSRCWRNSAVRPTSTARRPIARPSSTCCSPRPRASRSRPSRSKTTRWWIGRRSWTPCRERV